MHLLRRTAFWMLAATGGLLASMTSQYVLAQWHIMDVDTPKSFQHSSMVLNNQNEPSIAYGGDHLYQARWNGASWEYEIVDSSRGVGAYPSLALDIVGTRGISYFDAIHENLKFARWSGVAWTIETVDSQGSAGWYSSLDFDDIQQPAISYYDMTNGDLKLAVRNGSSWDIEIVDSTGDVGRYCSLVTDSAGHYVISYYDATNGDLKLARWDGAAWRTEIVDDRGDAGHYSSLILNPNGNPVIAYYESTKEDLKLASWDGVAWTVETIDESGDVGRFLSMQSIRATDQPAISYYDGTNQALKHAGFDGAIWTIETVDFDGDVGHCTCLSTAKTGRDVFISYRDNTSNLLKLAHFDERAGSWQIETVDSAGDAGQYTSLAIDASGHFFLSYYYTGVLHELRMASWDGAAWTLESVDSSGDAGMFSSLAVNPAEDPAVSYYDAGNQDLKFARWDGSTWDVEAVDTYQDVGQYSSLAFDDSGNPTISYFETTSRNLKFARWDGSVWTSGVIDGASSVGLYTSLAYDLAGTASISYYNWSKGDLRFVRDPAGQCSIETVDSSGNVGWHTSLAFDPTGNPAISYYDIINRDLKIALCDGVQWSLETVDRGGDVGAYTSLAFNPEGHPAISYYDWSHNDLKYARWDGSAWQIESIDSDGDVGGYTSLIFDSMGNPAVSYYDRTNGYLKVAMFPYLRYQAFALEDDRCSVSSPPGADGRINPGEEVDLRISITNISDFLDFSGLTATIEPVTFGVTPFSFSVDYPDLPAGQSVQHQGSPLIATVPQWLNCGDEVLFRISLNSNELGGLPPQYFTMPVDGDPGDCRCQDPLPDLQFESFALQQDRCAFASPPGGDGSANPGEDVDLRISIQNTSLNVDYSNITGTVEALTPGITPAQTLLDFGNLQTGQIDQHLGNPLTLSLPLSLRCGDLAAFSLTLSSTESGELPLQYFTVPVDGDPAKCKCQEPPPDLYIETLIPEADRCFYSGTSGGDGHINPGEEVDFRLTVGNISEILDYHGVSASIEVLTPGVRPSGGTVDFGTLPATRLIQHPGDPLILNIPLSLTCGDRLEFRVTISSEETGDLTPQILNVLVDGDPVNCPCTPVDLRFEFAAVEDDRCAFASPPGSDGRVNPGEDIDIRVMLLNGSFTTDLTMVAARLESLTPGVTPANAVLDFGTLSRGQSSQQLGPPLVVSVPLSMSCGDELEFLITLDSSETGVLPAEYFSIPVDGDAGNCNCEDNTAPMLHRGFVSAFSAGWRLSALPLTSSNDDETDPFPVAVTAPGSVTDDSPPDVPLILYRYLLPGDQSSGDTRLSVVKRPDKVEVHLE
ncbi:hypothetical protein ACFLU6_09035 [Acidobacteriota bacterium]